MTFESALKYEKTCMKLVVSYIPKSRAHKNHNK